MVKPIVRFSPELLVIKIGDSAIAAGLTQMHNRIVMNIVVVGSPIVPILIHNADAIANLSINNDVIIEDFDIARR